MVGSVTILQRHQHCFKRTCWLDSSAAVVVYFVGVMIVCASVCPGYDVAAWSDPILLRYSTSYIIKDKWTDVIDYFESVKDRWQSTDGIRRFNIGIDSMVNRSRVPDTSVKQCRREAREACVLKVEGFDMNQTTQRIMRNRSGTWKFISLSSAAERRMMEQKASIHPQVIHREKCEITFIH